MKCPICFQEMSYEPMFGYGCKIEKHNQQAENLVTAYLLTEQTGCDQKPQFLYGSETIGWHAANARGGLLCGTVVPVGESRSIAYGCLDCEQCKQLLADATRVS